jgi:hypothetical protein
MLAGERRADDPPRAALFGRELGETVELRIPSDAGSMPSAPIAMSTSG